MGPERDAPFSTISGEPVKPLYTESDLQGASDEDTHALRDRISSSLAGARVRDLERLRPDVLARILPTLTPMPIQTRPRTCR